MERKLLFKKYRIKKLIYSSNFSDIYEGFNEKEKEKVAIKVEKKNNKNKYLESEAFILFNLQGFGIPKFITYGKNISYDILIEELLGKTILDLFQSKNNKKEYRLKNICMLALQIIDRLEYIHSRNIIHRDIKPNNFLIGRKDPKIIYLIDFGFAHKFKSTRTGKHIKYRNIKILISSLKYISVNATNAYEQSRRDDLESLGYMLIFLLTNKLPWMNLVDDKILTFLQKQKKISELKIIKPEILFKGIQEEFIYYIKYCRNLEFEEDPNYEYLKSLFISILVRNNLKNDLYFFWIPKKINIENDLKNKDIMNSKRRTSSKNRLFKKVKNSLEKKIIDKKLSSFENYNNLSVSYKKNNNSFLNNKKFIYPINTKSEYISDLTIKIDDKTINNKSEEKGRNNLIDQKNSKNIISNEIKSNNLKNFKSNINIINNDNNQNKSDLNKIKKISKINLLNINSKTRTVLPCLKNNNINNKTNYISLEERKKKKIITSINYYNNNYNLDFHIDGKDISSTNISKSNYDNYINNAKIKVINKKFLNSINNYRNNTIDNFLDSKKILLNSQNNDIKKSDKIIIQKNSIKRIFPFKRNLNKTNKNLYRQLFPEKIGIILKRK